MKRNWLKKYNDNSKKYKCKCSWCVTGKQHKYLKRMPDIIKFELQEEEDKLDEERE